MQKGILKHGHARTYVHQVRTYDRVVLTLNRWPSKACYPWLCIGLRQWHRLLFIGQSNIPNTDNAVRRCRSNQIWILSSPRVSLLWEHNNPFHTGLVRIIYVVGNLSTTRVPCCDPTFFTTSKNKSILKWVNKLIILSESIKKLIYK